MKPADDIKFIPLLRRFKFPDFLVCPAVSMLLLKDSLDFSTCHYVLIQKKDYDDKLVKLNHHAFEYQKRRFLVENGKIIEIMSVLDLHAIDIPELLRGKTADEIFTLHELHGKNLITIETPSLATMIFTKISEVFYLFQIASVVVWLLEGYTTYAYLIFTMSVVSIIHEIYTKRNNENQLRSLMKDGGKSKVFREGRVITVDNSDLVIGDLIYVSKGSVPCDLGIVSGDCVVDESSLTGESVPVVKTAWDGEGRLDLERNKRNVLFGGSRITEVKGKTSTSDVDLCEDGIKLETILSEEVAAKAIVLSTGFSTTKGELFKSIMFPTKTEFKFNQDAKSFLSILGVIALVAFFNRVYNNLSDGMSIPYSIFTSLDIITIAVPPALPLILTVGIGFSIARLKKKKIYCIDPARLHYAGKLEIMCWDKTGTLTVPEMQFVKTHPEKELDFGNVKSYNSIERFMVLCHNLTKADGEIIGHQLDKESFKVTGFEIQQNLDSSVEMVKGIDRIRTVKRFEFDSHLQRSLVVGEHENGLVVHIKGSPEAIKPLLREIPPDYDSECNQYSIEGYYVIACAVRKLDSTSSLIRSEIESNYDFEFIGFLLFQNLLKPESVGTFAHLHDAGIQSIIITGDNALTAIHVSRQLELLSEVWLIDQDEDGVNCSSVPTERHDGRGTGRVLNKSLDSIDGNDSLAITGAALHELRNNREFILHRFMSQIKIFSRAKPDDKMWIVNWFITKGKFVGMCGDGTNDCSALKAAHVGLALSSAEASIVAPFTSAKKSISDMVELVREGRCALETSFVGFKYMTVYPLIQLMISATLNQYRTGLSNNQFLFDDMFIVTVLALVSLWTRPKLTLSKTNPVDSLFHKEILFSLLGQLGLCVGWFVFNSFLTVTAPWYCSAQLATSKLGPDFLPLDPSLGTANYPCFP